MTFNLTLPANHPHQPPAEDPMTAAFNMAMPAEVADPGYDAAVAAPFFDIDACINAALDAAVSARRTGWEHHRRGNLEAYYSCIERAAFYRRRARLWKVERDG